MKLKQADLVTIRDKAIQRFVGYPYRARLDGMTRDLDDDDKRALAFFEASVELMNNLGWLRPDFNMEDAPHVYTEVQEVISDQTYGLSFTQQKK